MGYKILLIDDSAGIRVHVREHLTKRGHTVQVAANLDEFDKIWAVFDPDAVVTDVVMPDVSGVRLLSVLTSKYRDEDLAFILMSSKPNSELKQLAAACGAHAWASKMDGLSNLTAVIETTVRRVRGEPGAVWE